MLVIINKKYDDLDALNNVLNYASNNEKTKGLAGTQNMLADNSFEQIMAVNRYFHNTTQKIVIHFMLSFADCEYITPNEAVYIGYRICDLLPEYQIKFGVHQNTDHLHIHFAMSPVSLVDGHKFYFDNHNLFEFLSGLRMIFEPYGINVDYAYSNSSNEFQFSEQL